MKARIGNDGGVLRQECTVQRKLEPASELSKTPALGGAKVDIRKCASDLVHRLRAGPPLSLLECVLAEELLATPRRKHSRNNNPSVSVLLQFLNDAQLRAPAQARP